MKSLGTLLKLARRQLEALRRALGAQLGRQRQVAGLLAAHEETLQAEQQLALRDHESALAFSSYSVRALQERRALESEHASIEGEIDRLRSLIAEAHAEARKFERLIELEEAREKARREKYEDAELDELATLRSGRRR